MHEMYCLIPPLVVILLGIYMRRAFEPLLIGCIVGFLLIDWAGFPDNFINALQHTLQDKDMVWIILVCGLYGSLIHLLIQSGGVLAFGEWALRFVRSRRSALLATWFMGLFLFIDDYMSALSTGVTMRKITDRFQISRIKLAYLVNATAAPVCLIIPLTTWSIYVSGLLEKFGVAAPNEGFQGFMYLIPYMFYPWLVVIMALLLAMGVLPLFGKMKEAEQKAAALQPLQPVLNDTPSTKSSHALYFFLPLVVLILATLFLGKDALKGVLAGLVFTFILYWAMNVMRPTEFTDGVFEGFKSMILALGILTMSYVLKKVGDEMGLTPFVIKSVGPYLSKEMLPAIVFVVLGFISYTTASSWGMYAVAIPIVAPLAQALGADMALSIAAVVSAGGFGSQASFFSDVTVLTATSTETDNVDLSFAQLPYNLIAAAGATVLFFMVGRFL